MTAVTTIDRATAKAIAERAEQALQNVADELGLTLTYKGGKFDPTTGTFAPKFEFSVETAGESKFAQQVRLLSSNYPNEWLTASDFGATFTAQGKQFKIFAINLKAPKFPIQAKCLTDGKNYKFSELSVKIALGR